MLYPTEYEGRRVRQHTSTDLSPPGAKHPSGVEPVGAVLVDAAGGYHPGGPGPTAEDEGGDNMRTRGCPQPW